MIGYFPSRRGRRGARPRGPLHLVAAVVALVTAAGAAINPATPSILIATFAVVLVIVVFFVNRAAQATHADSQSESTTMETHKPSQRGTLWAVIILMAAALIGAVLALALPRSAEAQGAPRLTRGAFLIMTGADTSAIERFSSLGDSLQSDLTIKNNGRVLWVGRLTRDFAFSRLALSFWSPNASPDAPAVQTAVVIFRDDSAIVDVPTAGRTITQRLKTLPGAIASTPSSILALELVSMRAAAAGGTLDVPIWTTSGGISVTAKVVATSPGKSSITLGGVTYLCDIDASGHILSATLGMANLKVSRVDAATADKLSLGKPDYSAPSDAPYTADEVSFTTPAGVRLGGTLTKPKGANGKLPAVVTITGSGQQDRDEFIPVGGGYRLFRQVADTLGRRGIAVLRLDDRTVGASGGTIGTSADYADDIRAAIAFLRARADIDGKRLAVLGHSEGGLIGPMVAASDAQLAGLVVLAGPSDNGLEILRFQNRYVIDHDTTIAPARREALYQKAYAAIDTIALNDKWFGFFLKYDPIATAKKVKTPTIILQGATDQQVTPEQAPKLAAAIRANGNSDVTLRVFPELNHLFIHDPSGNPSGYSKLTSNKVSPEVLGALADWLVTKLGATIVP